MPSLEVTQVRLQTTEDEAEVASVAAFFESHGVFVHEIDAATLWLVRKFLVRMMDMLRSGAIRPSIGPLAPLRD